MQKYIAEIYVPDDADWQTVEDAKLKANWRRVFSREERMAKTNLEGKCGSCKHFKCINDICLIKSEAKGICCCKERTWYRSNYCARTYSCKHYERKENGEV